MKTRPRARLYSATALIALLSYLTSFQILIAVLNPEAFFLWLKLGGRWAQVYLLSDSVVSAALACSLFIGLKVSSAASLTYFGYHVLESLTASFKLFSNPSTPLARFLGLALSMVLVFSEA